MWTLISQWGGRLGDSNFGAVCYLPYWAEPNRTNPSCPATLQPISFSKSATWRPGWRWVKMALVSLGRHSEPLLTPAFPLHRGDAGRQRRRDTEPQVPTPLADKSNLSLWPLTLEVAMEPSSRGIDGACWDCSQQGWVNMGCCENYEDVPPPPPPLSYTNSYTSTSCSSDLTSWSCAGARALLSLTCCRVSVKSS